MTSRIVSTSLILCLVSIACADEKPPAVITLDGPALLSVRHRAMANDPVLADALKSLRHNADRALNAPLQLVTDKTHVAPSGDKHDYVSLGTYVWPNPDTPNHLPYISKDGVVNPETKEYDHPRLTAMAANVFTLAHAWYLTGNDAYAKRSAEQLRAWFLDPATKMNPHLEYSQFVPGKNTGRGTGIIDTHYLRQVVDAAGILQQSGAWSPEDHKRLQKWFADFTHWLLTSKNGQDEARATNNHGVWYDAQICAYAIFSGDRDLARKTAEGAKSLRIAKQIEPDGKMPRELARTRAFTYTNFNLEAFFTLANLARQVDVDLWNYRTADGRSIRGALDWFVPYMDGTKTWPYKQITGAENRKVVLVLRIASRTYKEPKYEQVLSQLPGVERDRAQVELLWPAR